MTKDNRPLSPHIQIYKPQITSLTSILHRITGALLYFGVVAICIFISYYTYQINVLNNRYECDCLIMKSIIYIIISAWSFSIYYHFCNGIRHLFWDIGKGFDIKIAKRTGLIVFVMSFILTISSFAFVLFI